MTMATGGTPEGTRGPLDDFFCSKYQVWYRVEACVYRGRNRTFPGCVDCIQGYVNIRSVARGVRPPMIFGSDRQAALEPRGSGTVLPLRRASRD